MDHTSPLLAISSQEEDRALANQVAAGLGYSSAIFISGTPAEAVRMLAAQHYSPRYIMINIGLRGQDVLPELDQLAELCDASTRVVVYGQTNDITFYRALVDRGVAEYFTAPVAADALRQVLARTTHATGRNSKVIAFIGGASGDGSSLAALNSAYAIALKSRKPTVLVDLDYQFGMVARHLELSHEYGVREIFEHPERGIDETLLERMAATYRDGLQLITSPSSLGYMPAIDPQLVHQFIAALRSKYQYVLLDLPHVWTSWTAAVLGSADHIVMVSQLWLKSVTHSSRLIKTLKHQGFLEKPLSVVINRSGSKFREAVHPKDFERVCGQPISFYLPNDIKTVARAENLGKTVVESGQTMLANELNKLAENLMA